MTAEPGRTYQYDAENRMKSVNGGGSSNPEYTYDANGRRIRKKIGSTITDYIYDAGGSVIAERKTTNGGSSWAWEKGYVFLGSAVVAQYEKVIGVSGATTYFVHKDHLGSTRVLTKPDKTYSASDVYDFLPYGESNSCTGSGATPNCFTGHERDAETSLDYMKARYYSPGYGRFLSPDPVVISARRKVNPQVWNVYAYVANNPLKFLDPDGLELVQLGQHTGKQIKEKIKGINRQLKNKKLSSEEKEKLRAEKRTLEIEKEGNRVVGRMLNALDKIGQRGDLQLSDFTVSTDTKKDFEGNLSDRDMEIALSDQAFVLKGYGKLDNTIYIRTEPSNGFYQLSQKHPDYVFWGASALRHEAVHRFGNLTDPHGFYVQDLIHHAFRHYYRNEALHKGLDEALHEEIQGGKK